MENGHGKRWFDVVVQTERSFNVADHVWASDGEEALVFALRRARTGQLGVLPNRARLRTRRALQHPVSFVMRPARA